MSFLFSFLLLVSLIGLIAGLIRPSLYLRFTKTPFSRKKTGLILGALTIILFVLSVSTAETKPAKINTTTNFPQESKEEAGRADYEVVFYEDNKNVENYWVLANPNDKSKEALEALARAIKKEKCKKPCNVSIYDDQKAIDLDLQYNKIRNMEEANVWKEKNYIYVADHLLGYLEFEGDGYFKEYPFRDWYYKQLKGN